MSENEKPKINFEEELAKLTDEDLAYYRANAQLILPDEQLNMAFKLDGDRFKVLVMSAHSYLKEGIEPDFSDDLVLDTLFSFWKIAIDSSYTNLIKKSIAGQNGGAPKGNQNARKRRVKPSDKGKTNKNNQKQAETNENNLKDKDIVNDNDNDNDNDEAFRLYQQECENYKKNGYSY